MTGHATDDQRQSQGAEPAPVQELPASVRAVVVGWAAETLGGLPPAQVPATLLRVARFTPSKRARLGAAALAAAVDGDGAFRSLVAARANGSAAGQDPAAAAAAAYLLRLPAESELLAAAARAVPEGRGPELEQLRRSLREVRQDLRRTMAEREQALARFASETDGEQVADKLRRRLREQGTRLRQAVEAAQASSVAAQDELASLRREVVRLEGAMSSWQERARVAAERADRAQETLGLLRERSGRHRATADRRLELLLSTVEGAAAGLRREWDLTGGGPDPAELVARGLPISAAPPESTADPSRLAAWLGLPMAHMVVDGYNVTKTGFPDLTLAQQRERLVRTLSALSARTSAEVTVVFDGASVIVPAPPGRGIRVLFSPQGVLADDVIRDLAAAEPRGRVVVVISSDREVADGVRRTGARTAGASVLLPLLG